MNEVEAKFRARTPRSAAFVDRAAAVIPGGETRSSVYHPPYSVVMDCGKGTRLFDIDGNEYVDLTNNYTCLVHGHAYPPVVEAAKRAVERGSTVNAKVVAQAELAEIIVDRIASIDEVRFANSGAEAVQSALLIARGYSGRSKVLTSRWSYHGPFVDSMQLRPGNVPDFVGTYMGEWGDAESFERILAEHGNEIAIVLLEPWLGAGGLVTAPREFFLRVQEAARKAGALFCFDEVTVFRLSTGGAQALLDVQPDLTVLGKITGGGFPGGGVGGRREVMELANPATGNVHISGTLSGNPVSMAAGTVAMRELTQERIDTMAAQTERVDNDLAASCARHGVPYSSRRIGSLMNVYFSETPPAANPVRTDVDYVNVFHLACMANGVFANPRAQFNLTTVATDEDLAEIAQRLDATIADVAAVVQAV